MGVRNLLASMADAKRGGEGGDEEKHESGEKGPLAFPSNPSPRVRKYAKFGVFYAKIFQMTPLRSRRGSL